MFENIDIDKIIGSAYRHGGKISHGLILEAVNDGRRDSFNGYKAVVYKKDSTGEKSDIERCAVVIDDSISKAIFAAANNVADGIQSVDYRNENGNVKVDSEVSEFLAEGGSIVVSPNELAGIEHVVEEKRFESCFFKGGASASAYGATVEESLEKGADFFYTMVEKDSKFLAKFKENDEAIM